MPRASVQRFEIGRGPDETPELQPESREDECNYVPL